MAPESSGPVPAEEETESDAERRMRLSEVYEKGYPLTNKQQKERIILNKKMDPNEIARDMVEGFRIVLCCIW